MKIYVGGAYGEQPRLREEAGNLFALGHQITGTWLYEVQKPATLSEKEWHRCLALKDLAEVASADCIITDLDGVSSSGGRYVEWGYALGRHNMLKVLVGKSNWGVFNTLADLTFPDWATLIECFRDRYSVRK